MTAGEKVGVRRMVNVTIDRLERASVKRHDMGSRYSRLLRLLWRKTPMRVEQNNNADLRPEAEPITRLGGQQSSQEFDLSAMVPHQFINHSAFSWLDLDAVGNFATQNNSVVPSLSGSMGDLMDDPGEMDDLTLFTDYRWLNDDNPNMIF